MPTVAKARVPKNYMDTKSVIATFSGFIIRAVYLQAQQGRKMTEQIVLGAAYKTGLRGLDVNLLAFNSSKLETTLRLMQSCIIRRLSCRVRRTSAPARASRVEIMMKSSL